ncbi:PRC-barrel domain-containing protein [Paraburkholderia sp. DHOC27]|uniref:PRC-barrel domain-containing protein n=1 Tax=Paraburkholderia sp. DHOC27 TaxID=2303330 RepID=UPI000E3C1F20|nr:PRC-barrel domain-containing protein [Paraburkholderia sp. DHOC27]RFU48086.1 PRC-barrel domain containing protein [Paraburkholderia sp. DHOC27]
MSGGFRPPALRYLILLVLAAIALSGCSLLRGPQEAPITEAVPVLVGPASGTLVAGPPVTTVPPEPVETEAPKKPKRPPPPPRKIEEPPPPPVAAPAPPPPPPPPLIVTRLIDRSAAHGLLDADVQKSDGKVVGRAVDMVANAAGKPIEMVVNLQGFLGVGDRKVNFPWNLFRFTPNAKAATITLNLAPGQSVPADRSKTVAADTATATQLPMLDATVERANGVKVGRVVDVLIDANAQPQAVVLDVSSLVSTERRMIAANWSALRFGTRDKQLYPLMDLSDAQIAAAPVYAPNQPIRAVSPAPPPTAAAPASASSNAAAASTARAAR